MDASLAAVFTRHARHSPAPPADLEARLADVFAVGAAAWPTFALAADDFVRHLARLYPEGAPVAAWLAGLRADDLYLACGCALGVREALAAFDRACLGQLGKHLTQLRPSAAFVDEVRQALREKLLLARDGEPPKIAEYAGTGALAGGWLRVVATRVALDLRRRRQPIADAGAAAAALVDGAASPELGYVRGRYRALFQQCLAESVRALAAEARNLLRMHLVDGVTLEQLGQLFGMSRATTVRRLAAARALIVAAMRERVQAAIPLGDGEFDSLMGQLVSQLDVSLSTVL